MLKRVCSRCNTEKDLETGFYKNKSKKLGFQSECIQCRKVIITTYKKQNPDIVSQYAKKDMITRTLRRHKSWDNYIVRIIDGCKRRALKKGLPFDLTKEDVILPKRCPLLDIPLDFTVKRHETRKPEIDRIIPEKGYVKGNVRVICSLANRIKSDCTDWRVFQALADDAKRTQESANAEVGEFV